jgi:3-hydroxybutyryl-CoA dehydratase
LPDKLNLKLPAILDQFSEDQLIAAIPKIQLRQIFWDDLQEGDSVTLRVDLDPKLGFIYALLSGDHNPLNFDLSFSNTLSDATVHGRVLVPGTLLLAFISAVGGCYLTGENIYLEKKKEALFHCPLSFDSKTIFIKGEIARKYSQIIKGKERYYAEIPETVFIQHEGKLIKVAETVAVAGVLKKTRPIDQEKSKLIPEIKLDFPNFFSQLSEADLKKYLGPPLKKPPFKVGDSVEIQLRVSHKAILLYALISGDYNPLHTDPQFAKNLKAFDGKNIAHGALLSAWFSSGVLTLLGPGYRLVKKEEGIFKRAIKVGDTILIKLRIIDKYSEKVGGLQGLFIAIEEKLFVKEEFGQLTEAATSSSLYQLHH